MKYGAGGRADSLTYEMSAAISSSMIRLPARLAGPLNPQLAIVIKATGKPASAATNAASMLPPSWARGLIVHCMMERMGRRRNASRPPAMAAAISIAAFISWTVTMLSVCTCLA